MTPSTPPDRLVVSGADLVLPDRVVAGGTLVIEQGRIVELIDGERPWPHDVHRLHLRDHYVVPGFIDVHVHGVEGHDALGPTDAVEQIARRLPRYGVTAFCPTSVACTPAALQGMLDAVRRARNTPQAGTARVLPGHLESNFISPEYAGAQPAACLCASPFAAADAAPAGGVEPRAILDLIERFRPDVGIVTLAPELAGGLDLVGWLVERGVRVSLGHSGASFEQAMAAIERGARAATHLFNRMPPVHHRDPGLAGAVLASDLVAAEIIADGHHVHPAMIRTTVAAKGPTRVMAITDGTAGSGLAVGARASLGGRSLVVGPRVCELEDGTVAGSRATMDVVFRTLVGAAGLDLTDAAQMCATTPARELGMQGFGVLGAGGVADFVALDRAFRVALTCIDGRPVYQAGRPEGTD